MKVKTFRCRMNRLSVVVRVVALFCVSPVFAQTNNASDGGYWSRWLQRSDKAKQEQPRWITPLATTTPRLEQEFRYDVLWRQSRPGANYTVNLGNSKGLELIPVDKVEVIVAVPPYTIYNNPSVQDGFGDLRMLLKYRLLSANETNGDYIVTAFLDASVPTAGDGNGQPSAVLSPTIAYGKGIVLADVQGTFSVALPTGNKALIGRTYTWNNAIQYQVLRRFWPELEVNASFFQDGKNDGKNQVLITPGLVAGRFPLTRRVGLTVGAGVQIAVSEFHTTEHNVIVSIRLPF